MRSEELIQEFLSENKISLDVVQHIKLIDGFKGSTRLFDKSIINHIIVDSYNGFSESVKTIASAISCKHNVFLGRKEKRVLKKALDYEVYDELRLLVNLNGMLDLDYLQNLVKEERVKNAFLEVKCRRQFLKKLIEAIENKNKKRVSDYLNFLYSRLLRFNEFYARSLHDIFIENEKLIDKGDCKKIKEFCSSNTEKINYDRAVLGFNSLYQEKIIDNGAELYETIIININQGLFNEFGSKEKFYSYVFDLIVGVYKKIQNHRSLLLKVENILFKEVNIKWEVYYYLTIFSETFFAYEEKRGYYKPEEVCIDYLTHKYSVVKSNLLIQNLRKYYRNEPEIISELSRELNTKDLKNELDFFKKIRTGFQFKDCIVLERDQKFKNTSEISFIENTNELLLIFTKHLIDDRKLPCPVCSSLKISGNSYPEIGIKSWECKNTLCSERSKTNRGKRYSSKSNDMQYAANDDMALKDNIISKDLIRRWRKDIVSSDNYDSLTEMIVRYFSYSKGRVLFLNFNNGDENVPKDLLHSRQINFSSVFGLLPLDKFDHSSFGNFINNELMDRFIYNDPGYSKKSFDLGGAGGYRVFNEDCLTFLRNIPPNTIDHMVTSPPYYNAREYSHWKNLYNYLNDMYRVCLASFDALVPGGVFFYNIGDVFDNPNTIVKSKMGDKRLALGAYLILLFKKAGFELLDNIVWNKGETQSNRHKNDGNFTPYYQRPANCYEHMFVFKKPGVLTTSKDPKLVNNIQKFSPVIKINSKGENNFGHTAPFPADLPVLSILTFTKEGGVVFDPFLGSGTSVYTALKNNRKGVGTELSHDYFELAKKIIKTHADQPTLF